MRGFISYGQKSYNMMTSVTEITIAQPSGDRQSYKMLSSAGSFSMSNMLPSVH